MSKSRKRNIPFSPPKREDVLSVLSYDTETGLFHWLNSFRKYHVKGAVAGSFDSYGYRQIRVKGKVYLAHRLAWLVMMGVWPESDIDHKDRNRSNNRWSNLRLATPSQNMQNMKSPFNSTGYKGATKHFKKFKAQISFDMKKIHIGLFDTAEQASRAYEEKRKELHGKFLEGQP